MHTRNIPEEIRPDIENSLGIIDEAFQEYLNTYEFEREWFQTNDLILLSVAVHYRIDADRIKRYHHSHKIDAHKIAGYYTYWLCKLKPYSPILSSIPKEKHYIAMNCNTEIALRLSLGRLGEKKEKENRGNNGVNFPSKMGFDLFYTLKYRPLNPDLLSMIYYLIDELDIATSSPVRTPNESTDDNGGPTQE